MWRAGEVAAVQYLVKQGWTIVARNWRCSLGELDIVARTPGPDPVLVFCEVKARASADFGGPEGAVGWKKQQRLRRLAAAWLAERRPAHLVDVRFDVAAVVGAKVHVIEHAF